MTEPRTILKVELLGDNTMRVSLGVRHEGFLCLALRKASLYVDEVLLGNEIEAAETNKSPIITPPSAVASSIIDQL